MEIDKRKREFPACDVPANLSIFCRTSLAPNSKMKPVIGSSVASLPRARSKIQGINHCTKAHDGHENTLCIEYFGSRVLILVCTEYIAPHAPVRSGNPWNHYVKAHDVHENTLCNEYFASNVLESQESPSK